MHESSHGRWSFQDQQEANRVETRRLVGVFLLLVASAGWFAGAGFERMRGTHLWAEEAVEGWTRPIHQDYRYLIAGTALLLGCAHLLRLRRRGHEIVLGLVGAKPLEERRLESVLEEMSIAAAMPAPRLYLVEDETPNAFAVGWDERRSAVAVTRGLLERLSRDELQAVVAHEIAHIRNGDTKLLTLLVGMSRAVAVLAPFALGPLGASWSVESDGSDDAKDSEPLAAPRVSEPFTTASLKKGGLLLIATPFLALGVLVVSVVISVILLLGFTAIFMLLPLLALAWAAAELFGLDIVPDESTGLRWVAVFVPVGILLGPAILLVGIVAPVSLLLLRFAVARTREYDADAGAVELTRNPLGLLGALRKLDAPFAAADSRPWPSALRPMCIRPQRDPASKEPSFGSLLSTHPPLSERIRRVEAML